MQARPRPVHAVGFSGYLHAHAAAEPADPGSGGATSRGPGAHQGSAQDPAGGQGGASNPGGRHCVEALASGDPAVLAVGSPRGLGPCQERPQESFVAPARALVSLMARLLRPPLLLRGEVIAKGIPRSIAPRWGMRRGRQNASDSFPCGHPGPRSPLGCRKP